MKREAKVFKKNKSIKTCCINLFSCPFKLFLLLVCSSGTPTPPLPLCAGSPCTAVFSSYGGGGGGGGGGLQLQFCSCRPLFYVDKRMKVAEEENKTPPFFRVVSLHPWSFAIVFNCKMVSKFFLDVDKRKVLGNGFHGWGDGSPFFFFFFFQNFDVMEVAI